MSGELPKQGDNPPASTQTSGEAPPAQTEPATASEAELSQEQGRKPRTDAETRKQELAAEIQTLLDKRAALRAEIEAKPDDKRNPSPAGNEQPDPNVRPVKPDLDAFENHVDYEMALEKYHEDLGAFAARQVLARERAEAERAENAKAFQSRLEETRKKYADFDEAMDKPFFQSPAIAEAITTMTEGLDLAYHFANHPEDAERIGKLPAPRQMYELGVLASKLSAPAQTASPAAPTKPKVPSAPPPPTVLTGRNTGPADESAAALASGDVGRFMELENAKDLARLR